MTRKLDYRNSVLKAYPDVYTPAALEAMEVLAPLNHDRQELMARRIARRLARERGRQRIAFLDPEALIPRTGIRVQDARDGNFDGSEIPPDLRRQWIQGTGPAARPSASTENGMRNVAYALLSGADGWMFDGEDALGQVETMSLDNQRNLKLAIARRSALPAGRRAGRRRDERVGARFLRATHRRRLAPTARLHHQDLSARAVCTSTTATCDRRTAPASRRRSSMSPSTSSTTTSACASRAHRSCCTCRRSRPPRRRRCGTTSSRRSSSTSACRSARSRSTCSSSRSKRASS